MSAPFPESNRDRPPFRESQRASPPADPQGRTRCPAREQHPRSRGSRAGRSAILRRRPERRVRPVARALRAAAPCLRRQAHRRRDARPKMSFRTSSSRSTAALAPGKAARALLTWMFGIAHHQLLSTLSASHAGAGRGGATRGVAGGRDRAGCRSTRRRGPDARGLRHGPRRGRHPAQREIFDLYYGEGQPMKRIARDLARSNQAVKISLFRTRRGDGVATRGVRSPRECVRGW